MAMTDGLRVYRDWLVSQRDWATDMATEYAGTNEMFVETKSQYYGDMALLYINALSFFDSAVGGETQAARESER